MQILDAELGAGFGPGTAVRAYWLPRCTDFIVVDAHGSEVGTVDEIEADGDALVLVYRRGRRRYEIDSEEVETVWPAESILQLAPEPTADAIPLRAVVEERDDGGGAGRVGAVALVAAALGRHAGTLARRIAELRTATGELGRRSAAEVARSARLAGRETRRGLAAGGAASASFAGRSRVTVAAFATRSRVALGSFATRTRLTLGVLARRVARVASVTGSRLRRGTSAFVFGFRVRLAALLERLARAIEPRRHPG